MAERTANGSIKVHRLVDRFDEAVSVVKAIGESKNQTWAVLARTNSLLEIVEAELLLNGIPYRLSGGRSVWDGMVGSALVGLLKSLQADSWTGMANALSMCGIKSELLNLDHTHKNCDQMLEKILSHMEDDADARAFKMIQSVRRGCVDWRKQMADGNVSLAIYAASKWLAYYIKSDRVLLSTLHGSKGLEFDCVWVIGAEDNNLPHPDSTEDEERRLFYVGMTRARDRLEISSSLADGAVSRFIKEAGLNA